MTSWEATGETLCTVDGQKNYSCIENILYRCEARGILDLGVSLYLDFSFLAFYLFRLKGGKWKHFGFLDSTIILQ